MAEKSKDTSLLEYLAEQALEDIRRARQFKRSQSNELLREAEELSFLVSKLLAKRDSPSQRD
ncbi:MAG: hypothetical protein OQJ97_02260 [Rhodospirillales bacterium]|nr:hypothetical protein [Rhodospirillales bacterium]